MSGVFSNSNWHERPDWNFLQNGHVNLFQSDEVLNNAISSLQNIDYKVAELDCSSTLSFCKSTSEAFFWQEQFGYSPWDGSNLNALNDGMREDGTLLSDKFLLVARNLDSFEKIDPYIFNGFWDIFEYQGRNALLFGQARIGFIQVANRNFELPNLGSRAASWNDKEWSVKDSS